MSFRIFSPRTDAPLEQPVLLPDWEPLVAFAQVGPWVYDGEDWSPFSFTSVQRPGATPFGGSVQTTGESTPASHILQKSVTDAEYTVLAHVRLVTFTTFDTALWFGNTDGSSGFMVASAGAAPFKFNAVGRAGHAVFTSDASNGTGASVATYSDAALTANLYRDGAFIESVTHDVAGSGVSFTAAGIGGRSGASNRNWRGHNNLAVLFTKVLDAAVARDLSAHPWQIFKGPPVRIFIDAAAGGTPTIAPTGISTAEAFGTAVITRASLATVSPNGIATGEAFGTSVISPHFAITTTGIESAEAFGTVVLAPHFSISTTGIASAEAFGDAVVSPTFEGVISPAGIASAEAFGTTTLSPTYNVAPVGISSSEAFGSSTVTRHRVESITVDGIATGEAFGTAVVTSETVAAVAPTGLSSQEAFGNATLTTHRSVNTSSITSSESFGSVVLTRFSGQTILVPSIGSAEAFGSATVSRSSQQAVSPAGIASSEAFGTPNLLGALVVSPAGIASAEAFGSTTVSGAGTRSLTEQDLVDIANAVWAHPKALTVARFLGLK